MARRTTSKAAAPQIKPTDLVRFHAALAAWYKTHGRHDLPWRQTDDPYRIWLSEVMLQQTQVATVLARFYHPFLKTFPNVQDLADAPREKVMKAWEGLGYYRRAGNLHEAAKKIVSSEWWVVSRGAAPPLTTHYSLLNGLPGIGRNTAHAILAFAYHQPVAILEANVKRVVARIFAFETPSDTELWQGAEALLNAKQPFDYNQAMMDVGSLICTPRKPACGTCPARDICIGKAAPATYPAPKAKKQVPTRKVIIHVREDAHGRFFLEKRDEKLLGGLYGFVQSPHDTRLTTHESLGTVTHVYSHFKLIGHVMHTQVRGATNSPDWYGREEITQLPLSKLDHKVLALVDKCNSGKKKPVKSKAHASRALTPRKPAG